MPTREYDVVIIGGGPAGLSAGLYSARARRRTLLIEKKGAGGQIATTDLVENYPGFPDGIDGFELGQLMHRQASKYGMDTEFAVAERVERLGDGRFHVHLDTEEAITAKVVIATAGADYNPLGLESEERLTGHGVSYCATCDAAFFVGQTVAVVGGGDSAMEEALFLTRYANKVYAIHRRDTLRASKIMQERALADPKIEFIWNTAVTEIEGGDNLSGVRLHNLKTGEEQELPLDGLFVAIGQTPNSPLISQFVTLDEGGHVPVDEWMETGVPGLYAAGDLRCNSARQVVSSSGDGATAAIAAERYLSEHFADSFA